MRFLRALPFIPLLAGCAHLQALPDPDAPPSAAVAARTSLPVRWQDIPVPALSWTPPLISSYADTIRPGVVVFWVPDNSLPLASIHWVWPEGKMALSGPAEAATDLLGDLLRRGGAGSLTGAQIDDTLEFLAAQAGIDVGLVRTTASVSGLSRDLPFLVDLVGLMITQPRLDPARLEVLKADALQGLEHRFDTPAQTAGLAWDRIAYGSGPWTSLTDSAELARVTRRDLQEVLKGRFAGGRRWISVAGRYDRAAVRRQLLKQLDLLDANAAKQAPIARLDSVPAPSSQAPRGVYIYDIPANQVQIRLGTRFVRRDHPDYYPLMLASYVLGGGGFGTRLVDRVRSDEGLAYHVASWAGSDYDREAMLGVSLQTKTASAGRALVLVREEIQHLADSGFRAGELDQARRGLSASIPSLFDTPENTADLLLQSGAWNRRDDHFRRYQRALDSIPDSTVLRVFRTWFRPDSMRIVIAGPADSLVHPFSDGSPAVTQWGPLHILSAKNLAQRSRLPFEAP